MDKVVCHEPAFLRDIHHAQIINYNETKDIKISERIDYLLEKADKQVKKMGYRVVGSGSKPARNGR